MSWTGELLKAVVSNFTRVIYCSTAVFAVTAYSFSGHNVFYRHEGDIHTAVIDKVVEDGKKTRDLMENLIEKNTKPILTALEKNTAALEKLEQTGNRTTEAIRGLTSAVSETEANLRSWRASDAKQLHHEELLKKNGLLDREENLETLPRPKFKENISWYALSKERNKDTNDNCT